MALAMKNPHDWPGILQKISPSLGPSQWTSSIISHQNNKHPANYSIHTLELSQKTPGFWGPNKSQTWAAASPRGSSRQRSVDPGLKKESSQQTKESSTDRNNPNHGIFCGLFDIVFFGMWRYFLFEWIFILPVHCFFLWMVLSGF